MTKEQTTYKSYISVVKPLFKTSSFPVYTHRACMLMSKLMMIMTSRTNSTKKNVRSCGPQTYPYVCWGINLHWSKCFQCLPCQVQCTIRSNSPRLLYIKIKEWKVFVSKLVGINDLRDLSSSFFSEVALTVSKKKKKKKQNVKWNFRSLRDQQLVFVFEKYYTSVNLF